LTQFPLAFHETVMRTLSVLFVLFIALMSSSAHAGTGVVIGSLGAPEVKLADLDGTPGVGFGDFLIFAGGFNRSEGDSDFDDRLDLNGDGTIGFGDFLLFATQFSG
tara:strand:- start:11031 stop:11348 length:318 start_codon:yes stop_codon:yes gene_type:complete